MNSSLFKNFPKGKFAALLGLALLPGAAQAANLLTATSTPTGPFAFTCGATGAGSGAAGSISVSVAAVTAPTGSNTITVTYTAPAGLAVTGASGRTIGSSNTPLTFTLAPAASCAGLNPGSNAITLQFKAQPTSGTANNDVAVSGTIAASLLVASPTSLTVTCSYDGVSQHVMGAPQTVTLTSPAALPLPGAPLTSALGTNLTTSSLTGGTATSAAVGTGLTGSPAYVFNVVETTPVGACPTTSQNLVLTSGSITKNIPVTFQVLPFTPLISSVASPSLSYVKGSATPVSIPITFTSTKVPNAFFTVDTTTLPSWLTVDLTSGVVTGGKTLNFATTNLAGTLSPGTYTGSVHFKVSGYGDLVIPFSLTVSSPAPTLSVEGGNTQSITWSVGSALPTATIVAVSSGAPIEFTVSTVAGTLAPQVASNSGLAYSFGTAIPVTFAPSVFASAVPGQILTGNVILTWGGGKTVTVAINVAVSFTSATATATSVVPTTLPTSAVGQTYTVTLYGTGFVSSSDPTFQTVAGIVNTSGATVNGTPNNAIATDPNVVATVVNSSTIVFNITVPATDTLLDFFHGAKTVTLGVCNPNGSSCSTPGASAKQTIVIASGPTFSSSQLLSSATFLPPSAIAPYDILTIFGSNFCTANGTGCTPGQVLYGTPTGTNPAYPTTLTPDAAGTGSTPRNLTVTFQNAATSPTQTANAPLLFATNNQINFLVPSIITSGNGWTNAYITIGFGATGSVLSSSVVGPFTVGTADPGIFTVNADGTGDGAILDTNFNLVSNTNPAAIRTGTGSDTVQIYGTGLGAPASAQITSYLAGLTNPPTTIDGLLLVNGTAPALAANPSVYIGGSSPISSGLVTYAGFVNGSVAGLYQVNAKLPANSGSFTDASGSSHTITGPVQLGVKIGTSQPGVSMWVVPELNLTAPTPLSAAASAAAWTAGSAMTATGSSPTFAVPSFELPTGMTIDSTGTITAAPTATGAYVVSATATDTSTPPVSGSLNFLLNVTGTGLLPLALATNSSGPLIRPSTYGEANGNVTTVIPTGTAPYTFSIAPSGLAAIGISIDQNGVVSTSATTPAGVYEVVVTVTDSAGTPLTNHISFPVTVLPALLSSGGETVTGAASTAQDLTTITALTGNSGSAITYSTNNTYGITVTNGVVHVPSTVTTAGTYYVDITATDATAPSGTGISSANAAGGVATIYVAIVLH